MSDENIINLFATGTITLDRETRTIRGQIVRYNTPTNDRRNIVIHDGALNVPDDISRVKLCLDHNRTQVIGYMSELSDDKSTAAFKVAPGEAGDQALADAENKIRDGLSVGIRTSTKPNATKYDADTDTFHVYLADLDEVSLTAFPAFSDARVAKVSASASDSTTHLNLKENHMDPETETFSAADLDARLSAHTDELIRVVDTRLAQANFGGHTAAPELKFANFGTFAKALASGDKDAITLANSRMGYLGEDGEANFDIATTGDTNTPTTWISDAIKFINERRAITNLFTRETLPDQGMSLEYLQLETDSIVIDEQEDEGDDLEFGKVTLTSSTAPVRTFGGYTKLSMQAIQRANAAYLNATGTAMDLAYARRTELATRQLLAATIDAQKTAGKDVELAEDAGLFDWLDLLVDAYEAFDDNGFVIAGAVVSKDVFKKLNRLEDSNGNALMNVYGQGVNRTGEIDFSTLTGQLGTVRFRLFPKAATETMAFFDPLALTTWESAGAPWQLQQDGIVDLSRAISKYGYLAQASQYPDAILPVTFA